MTKILRIGFSFLFFLFFASSVQAANSLDVTINEIAWMGTSASYNDEWVELYNNTDSPINLDNWTLKAKDGTPEINLAGELSAKGFFILERTNDETVPNIPADQIYTGAFGNSGEKLELYDSSGNLIDSVDCSGGWFAGDNTTKQTMERKGLTLMGSDSSNWQTSQNPGGTAKVINSEQVAINNEEEIKSEEPKIIEETKLPLTEEKAKSYPSGVFINEILPSPKGADSEEEWIELYNQNDFEIDLSGWKVSDSLGKTTTYIFLAGTKISAKGFLVLNRPITKITLNNDGDTLNLTQPSGNIVDKISFEKAPIGQSYNKIENSWVWSGNLTPGTENIIPVEKSKEENEIESNKEKGLAAISEILKEDNQSEKGTTKFSIILISAFCIAIFSGIIILFLKKKLKKED